MKVKNFQTVPVLIQAISGHTLRVMPGETKFCPPVLRKDAVLGGLAPIEGGEDLQDLYDDSELVAQKAAEEAKAAEIAAENKAAEKAAINEAATRANEAAESDEEVAAKKRSESAKKAAATRAAKAAKK